MKTSFKYIAILALGIVSCEPELQNPIDEPGYYSNGQADFSRYVALGNSLTAGYADNALYITGQENAYPAILAQQFSLTQETEEFTLPLMEDNVGGLLLDGNQIANNRLVLAVNAGNPAPSTYIGREATTDVTNTIEGPVQNMGVPGAKSFHLITPGYGSLEGVAAGTANPYFARFASSNQTSVLEDAMAQDPTFFSLWIGNNDVLSYATSGGTGEYQVNNTDPSTYDSDDITDPNVFASVYSQLVEGLTANNADGVLINIPDVTASAFFTTVPNNAQELDAETAANLTGFFQVVSQVFAGGLMQQGVPEEQAQALAAQYAITFEEGENRFLIDVPETDENPLGFRQMTEEELLLLTIDQGALAQGYGAVSITPEVMDVLGLLQAGEQPSQQQVNILFNAVNAIDDEDALDNRELETISEAQTAYNQSIEALADAHDLAFFDARALLNRVAEEGIPYDGGTLTSQFVQGGVFSLDGIHPTPRGHAALANEIIEAINQTYNASVPKVDVGAYGTVTLNNNVQ